MCTHCDRTCVKERFPSIYPLAQADLAQLVEHNLAKVGVAGSSPVVRSSEFASAVSPGEAALFVVVVTQDQAIARRATPQTSTRSMEPAASSSRVHARTHPQYTQKPGRPSSQGKLAARATRTLCQFHRRFGKPLLLRHHDGDFFLDGVVVLVPGADLGDVLALALIVEVHIEFVGGTGTHVRGVLNRVVEVPAGR